MTGNLDAEATTDPAGGPDADTGQARAGAGAPRPRFVITSGGRPDPAQLAALVVSLTPQPGAPPETGPPAWRHAALLEGVGGPGILTPGDLDVASPRGRQTPG